MTDPSPVGRLSRLRNRLLGHTVTTREGAPSGGADRKATAATLPENPPVAAAQPQFADLDARILGTVRNAGFEAGTVYDIGASNAFWSVRICDEVFPGAAFHLFEPLAETQASYSELLRSNLGGHPQFRLHPVALGDREGTVEFWTDSDGFSSTALNVQGVPGFARQNVRMVRLDDYVKREGLPLPDVIKIDVQGYEDRILRHGVRCMEHATVIQLEAWFYRGYGPRTPLLSEMIELLDSHGFDLAEIGDRCYVEARKLIHVDAFFLKREWARGAERRLAGGDWVYAR